MGNNPFISALLLTPDPALTTNPNAGMRFKGFTPTVVDWASTAGVDCLGASGRIMPSAPTGIPGANARLKHAACRVRHPIHPGR